MSGKGVKCADCWHFQSESKQTHYGMCCLIQGRGFRKSTVVRNCDNYMPYQKGLKEWHNQNGY